MIHPREHRAPFTVRKRLQSFVFAGQGLVWLVYMEPNARLHLAASVAVLGCGLWLRLPASEWRWLAAAMAMVWGAEAFNTAIENLCDHVCPEFAPAIGRIKDLAAGAVLASACAALVIGILTVVPRLYQAAGY